MTLCYSLLSGSVFKTETEIGPGHSTLLAVMDGFGDVVKNILVLDHSVKLVVQKWDTEGFKRHFFAYGITATTEVFSEFSPGPSHSLCSDVLQR